MRLLAFSPEPKESSTARYDAALAEPFDGDHVNLGSCTMPWELRRNTFDFEVGIRLAIYRVWFGRDRQGLVVSAFLMPGSRFDRPYQVGHQSHAEFAELAFEFFEQTSNRRWPLTRRVDGDRNCSWSYWLAPGSNDPIEGDDEDPTPEGADGHG